jgi:hypothetical protein
MSEPEAAPPVDDRKVRAETCNQEIQAILLKYNCGICVSNLNIASGKILPQVEVVAK